MKKFLCAILAAFMCMSFACAEGAEDPGFAILDELYDGESNIVISPVSLTFALAMAAEGAEGETKQEILGFLGLEDLAGLEQLQQALKDVGLRQANAAFLAQEIAVNGAYESVLEERYGAKWFGPEETGADRINAWVKDATDGMIDRVLESGLSPETMLVLVNAIAMDALWMAQFDPANTFDDVFHAPGGDVTVPFMHKEFHADYGERDGVQLLRLQYRNDEYEPTGLTMLIALPEAGGEAAALEGLRAEGLDYFTFEEHETKVKLAMPKVDIESSVVMNDVLNALGVRTAFGTDADFSGITDELPLKIDSVIQKARLQMDEDGTRAAAATVIAIETMAMPGQEEVVEFNMNRPFVLAIADEAAGAVCFAGVVADPAAN